MPRLVERVLRVDNVVAVVLLASPEPKIRGWCRVGLKDGVGLG